MPFHTLVFLFAFLPAVLGVTLLIPKRLQNGWILLASLFFYAWGAPMLLPFLLGIAWLDYRLSHWLDRIPEAQSSKRIRILLLTLAINLSPLVFFKYGAVWKNILLPMGISFITFQEMSYVLDVYRKEIKPAKTFRDYLLFLLFFPHTVAGPIFRWKNLAPQIAKREISSDRILSGLARFSGGLAKKVLIADPLLPLVDRAFLSSDFASAPNAWIALVALGLQVYFDFAGYSDMAVGLGRMFGFDLPENFNAPYLARSLSDFWKRWHMTLTQWIRDYLFEPLALFAMRRSQSFLFLALISTMLVVGLWHGPKATYLAMWAWHGFFLCVEYRYRLASRCPSVLYRFLVLFCVAVGWVFFRCHTLPHAFSYLASLVGAVEPSAPMNFEFYILFSKRVQAAMALGLLLTLFPVLEIPITGWRGRDLKKIKWVAVRYALNLLLIVFSILRIADAQYRSFIYLEF